MSDIETIGRLERDLDQVMTERDSYHETADKLAFAIAEFFGIDIGEHSNLNCPWDRAMAAITAAVRQPDNASEASEGEHG